MNLFRIDPDKPYDGPHQKMPLLKGGASPVEANAAMILVHGRGATAESMLHFSREFDREDILYRAPQADRQTWYPYSFMAPKKQNQPGINSGLQAIYDAIASIEREGLLRSKIIVLGFSQGACLATEFAARHPQKFGAVVGLSGGLIGQQVDPENYSGSMEKTPVFLGCSDVDPHIPKERVDITARVFSQLKADVEKKIYPGMPHTVNEDELQQVKKLLETVAEA